MIDWLIELKSIPRFEYIAYWVIAIGTGMFAGLGWGLYLRRRRDLSNNVIPPFSPKHEDTYGISNQNHK